MTTILIILGILVVVIVVRAINTTKQNKNKNELQNLMERMQREIFPNGKNDIDEGTKQILYILNHKVNKQTAQNIFVKSSSICYTASLNGQFSKERLKQHLAPYALHYFEEETLAVFYEYLLSKNSRAKEVNDLLEVSRDFSRSMNPCGTDKDEMPEGYGEFGLEITNPIPVRSIPDGYFYLNRLKTVEGMDVSYERIGAMQASNIQHTIDGYNLFVKGKKIAVVFICPYNICTSKKAPRGFKLI